MSAFADLLDRLASGEPRYGWSDAHQVPRLTDEDVATVLAEADDLLADAVCDMTFNTVLAAQLKSQEGTIHRYSLIGAALVHELEVLARHYLIGELRARADSEADQRAKDWRDFAADETGVRRFGEVP